MSADTFQFFSRDFHEWRDLPSWFRQNSPAGGTPNNSWDQKDQHCHGRSHYYQDIKGRAPGPIHASWLTSPTFGSCSSNDVTSESDRAPVALGSSSANDWRSAHAVTCMHHVNRVTVNICRYVDTIQESRHLTVTKAWLAYRVLFWGELSDVLFWQKYHNVSYINVHGEKLHLEVKNNSDRGWDPDCIFLFHVLFYDRCWQYTWSHLHLLNVDWGQVELGQMLCEPAEISWHPPNPTCCMCAGVWNNTSTRSLLTWHCKLWITCPCI